MLAVGSEMPDMVQMVVCDEYSLDAVDADAFVMKEFLYTPYSDTCIYQHSITILFKIITISTAPTAEGYEFQHFLVYILRAKIQKRLKNE